MIGNICKYSVKNILRNKFLSISSILVITLLMFFINVLWLIEQVSGKVIDSVNSKMSISLYLKDGFDEKSSEVITLLSNIRTLNSEINIDYKSKEQVVEEEIKKEPKLIKILENRNPLPVTISLSNIEINEYSKLNTIIENQLSIIEDNPKQRDYFANYSTQYQKINTVISILSKLELGIQVIVVIFFISIAIITYSVISNFVFYYRDEIYITKLVGGSNSFIYGPFIIQWMLYTLFSFFISLWIFVLFTNNINTVFGDIFTFRFSPQAYSVKLLLFLCIGAISWYLSSLKYLRRRQD